MHVPPVAGFFDFLHHISPNCAILLIQTQVALATGVLRKSCIEDMYLKILIFLSESRRCLGISMQYTSHNLVSWISL